MAPPKIILLCSKSCCPNRYLLGFPLSVPVFSVYREELAYIESNRAALEQEENKRAVHLLYAALDSGDAETVQRVLASDLEWWFHGPPSCQHLMRLLTGASIHPQFRFVPQTITAFADKVFAEGQGENDTVYWVHVWTVKDGIVTQIREYFNTSLVVTEFNRPSASPSNSLLRKKHACSTIWQSKLDQFKGKSMPGLVLAI